jgi:hypothetical protein
MDDMSNIQRKALEKAMWNQGHTNNDVTRYTADAVAEYDQLRSDNAALRADKAALKKEIEVVVAEHQDEIQRLRAEVKQYREAMKGAQHIAEVAGQEIRSLRADIADGRLVRVDETMALAMNAGAYAIEYSRRISRGAVYAYDIFGATKEILYYEAAKALRRIAEAALAAQEGQHG